MHNKVFRHDSALEKTLIIPFFNEAVIYSTDSESHRMPPGDTRWFDKPFNESNVIQERLCYSAMAMPFSNGKVM